jgi:DNA-binding response OmpR family regulator
MHQAGRRTRVLVVEDDRSIARLLELEFEHNGLSVRCAYDGPTGLESWHRSSRHP